MNKIEKIKKDLAEYEAYVPKAHCDWNFAAFNTVSENPVRKVISTSKPTTCETDPTPSKIIKRHLNILCPALTKIVDQYLSSGEFSNEWKTSVIMPLIKKSGADRSCGNYRPVNNLPFLSKVVERSALLQINRNL